MTKRYTKEDFVNKANIIHNNKYNYDKTIYIKSSIHVEVECPEHGLFSITPGNHLRGKECRTCGRRKASISKRKTTEQFITKAKEKYNDRYDYSLTNYITQKEKVKIRCVKHNIIFEQLPDHHLRKNGNGGCPECYKFFLGYDTLKRFKNKEYSESECFLYLTKFKNKSECFYKVGISKYKSEGRYCRKSQNGGYDVEHLLNIKNVRIKCWILEQAIINYNKEIGNYYNPNNNLRGYTECFNNSFECPMLNNISNNELWKHHVNKVKSIYNSLEWKKKR